MSLEDLYTPIPSLKQGYFMYEGESSDEPITPTQGEIKLMDKIRRVALIAMEAEFGPHSGPSN